MHQANHQQQQQQDQEPALASSKAWGRGDDVVGLYLTKSGRVAVEVRAMKGGRFRYTGAWGAGGGLSLDTMQTNFRGWFRHHKGWTAVVPFAGAEGC